MSYNTKEILRDLNNDPIPQYYDPITDDYLPLSNEVSLGDGNTISGNTYSGNTNSGNTISGNTESGNEITGNIKTGDESSGNITTGNTLIGNDLQGITGSGITLTDLLNELRTAINVEIGTNTELLAETTITWDGTKTYDYIEIPITTAQAIMLSIDNTNTASILTATFEIEVATDDWRQWYDGTGSVVTFNIPASTKGVFGAIQSFPRYLTGRIKLYNSVAPTNLSTTKVQVQEI